jgi:hypothetical protein
VVLRPLWLTVVQLLGPLHLGVVVTAMVGSGVAARGMVVINLVGIASRTLQPPSVMISILRRR